MAKDAIHHKGVGQTHVHESKLVEGAACFIFASCAGETKAEMRKLYQSETGAWVKEGEVDDVSMTGETNNQMCKKVYKKSIKKVTFKMTSEITIEFFTQGGAPNNLRAQAVGDGYLIGRAT